MAKAGARRQRGAIRRRGNSLQVTVYAGLDPLTGKRMFLSESTTDPGEAERIRRRLMAQVADERGPRTSATFGAALDSWLRTHEAEATTFDGYRGYVQRTIEPAHRPPVSWRDPSRDRPAWSVLLLPDSSTPQPEPGNPARR
jgi:hypothetical protein